MDTEIEKQKFDAVQELSKVEMALSDARVAFAKLKESEDAYLKEREDKVKTHLDFIQEALKESFNGFLQNKESFEKIKGIVSSFIEKAEKLSDDLEGSTKYIVEKLISVNSYIDTKIGNLKDYSNKLKGDRRQLDEDLENLSTRLRNVEALEKMVNLKKKNLDDRLDELIK